MPAPSPPIQKRSSAACTATPTSRWTCPICWNSIWPSVCGDLAGATSSAATYSQLYGLLGECFCYPDADLAESVRSGALAQQARALCGELDAGLLESLDLSALEDEAATSGVLSREFTRLFDAGARGTACSLNGGLQVGPQMKVMEEAVRFYGHFGLTLSEEQKELPDHLTTELNFLHFLALGEHELQAQGAC